jgi:hypothetical protein
MGRSIQMVATAMSAISGGRCLLGPSIEMYARRPLQDAIGSE